MPAHVALVQRVATAEAVPVVVQHVGHAVEAGVLVVLSVDAVVM